MISSVNTISVQRLANKLMIKNIVQVKVYLFGISYNKLKYDCIKNLDIVKYLGKFRNKRFGPN